MTDTTTDNVKAYRHKGVKFYLTHYVNFEQTKLWGYVAQSVNARQSPNWHNKKRAIESARFHIDQRLSGW